MSGPESDPKARRPGNYADDPTLWYRMARNACRICLPVLWRVRLEGRHFEPARGGTVYVCNHQSFVDPVLAGMALKRGMSYMARASLFRPPLFGRLIRSVGAFPVRRGKADLGALKEALRRIKAGGQVLIFAEGTRTRDGAIGPFLPGVALLSQRAAQWTVPVLIDGAHEAWPRSRALPGPGNIVVRYGEPISREQARSQKPADFVESVRQKLIELQADTRRRLGREPIEYE